MGVRYSILGHSCRWMYVAVVCLQLMLTNLFSNSTVPDLAWLITVSKYFQTVANSVMQPIFPPTSKHTVYTSCISSENTQQSNIVQSTDIYSPLWQLTIKNDGHITSKSQDDEQYSSTQWNCPHSLPVSTCSINEKLNMVATTTVRLGMMGK